MFWSECDFICSFYYVYKLLLKNFFYYILFSFYCNILKLNICSKRFCGKVYQFLTCRRLFQFGVCLVIIIFCSSRDGVCTLFMFFFVGFGKLMFGWIRFSVFFFVKREIELLFNRFLGGYRSYFQRIFNIRQYRCLNIRDIFEFV